jgi:hypothetical protein
VGSIFPSLFEKADLAEMLPLDRPLFMRSGETGIWGIDHISEKLGHFFRRKDDGEEEI